MIRRKPCGYNSKAWLGPQASVTQRGRVTRLYTLENGIGLSLKLGGKHRMINAPAGKKFVMLTFFNNLTGGEHHNAVRMHDGT